MKTLKELLIELDACESAINWAADRTIEQVVAECDRGDWLAWLAEKIKLDKRSLVLVGGHIANTVRHLMTGDRSKQAVDVCIAYGEGRATDEELNAAAGAAAWAAAGAAAWAAAWAAASVAGEAREAARAAANKASANQKQTADICRKYIGEAIIQQTNKLLTQ